MPEKTIEIFSIKLGLCARNLSKNLKRRWKRQDIVTIEKNNMSNKKVALINDTHFGMRNDNPHVLKFFCDFFEEQFFPTLLENDVDYIIHMGDLVDRRKFVNFNTATKLHECFTRNVIKNNMSLDIIVGNHDCAFKNTNRVNAIDILFTNSSYLNNINWFIDPIERVVKDVPVLYIPWICEENYEKSMHLINNCNSDVKYAFGHLELLGFEMYKGAVSETGLNRRMFEKFDHVWSGHFHHRSTIGNITYVGTQYEMMWSDYNDPRGFEIVDLETGERQFFQNERRLFHVIEFNSINPHTFNFNKYKHSFIKIIIDGQNFNEIVLESFIENLTKVDPIDIVVLNENELDLTNTNIDLSKIEDTVHTFNSAIDNMNEINDEKKKRLKNIMYEAYNEAQQVRV